MEVAARQHGTPSPGGSIPFSLLRHAGLGSPPPRVGASGLGPRRYSDTSIQRRCLAFRFTLPCDGGCRALDWMRLELWFWRNGHVQPRRIRQRSRKPAQRPKSSPHPRRTGDGAFMDRPGLKRHQARGAPCGPSEWKADDEAGPARRSRAHEPGRDRRESRASREAPARGLDA